MENRENRENREKRGGEKIKTIHSLPREWSWQYIRDSDADAFYAQFGKRIATGSYASKVVNQHRSNWCGCCYLVAAIQMLQDRLHLVMGFHNPDDAMFPYVELDMQAALNAYNAIHIKPGWNACRGGNPEKVLQAIQQNRIPLVVKLGGGDWHGYPFKSKDIANASIPIANVANISFTRREYPQILQARIFQYGPVVLGINAHAMNDPKIHKRGGIIDTRADTVRNHAVCVIGWRIIRGESCWIARNSWGMHAAPMEKPSSMHCVTLGENTCNIKLQKWSGDPQNPGYVYIPFHYKGLIPDSPGDIHERQNTHSPWFDCTPSRLDEMFPSST